MIRLIATDMDATLLDGNSELTPRTVRAVRQAMEAGARFVIASGRMYETVRPFAEQLGTNAPVIAFNGAMACDWQTGAPLFTTGIPVGIARGVCAMAESAASLFSISPNGDCIIKSAIPPVCDEYEARALQRDGDRAAAFAWIERPPLKLLCLGEHDVRSSVSARKWPPPFRSCG